MKLDAFNRDNTVPASLGVMIRAARARAGLSREKLGKRCGVSRTYLYGVERGDYVPSEGLCTLLARHLNLDADEVWLWAGHVPRDVLAQLQAQPKAGCALVRGEAGNRQLTLPVVRLSHSAAMKQNGK